MIEDVSKEGEEGEAEEVTISYDEHKEEHLERHKERDLEVLKVYKSMPQDFQDAISFKDFYPICEERLAKIDEAWELIEDIEDEE